MVTFQFFIIHPVQQDLKSLEPLIFYRLVILPVFVNFILEFRFKF